MKLIADLDGLTVAKGKNFVDPTSAQDLATKAYVDAVASGLEPKAGVVVIADANLTLSGAQTIDGVALSAGQRVLATAQTAPAQNGIWVVAAGAWTRPTDFASAAVIGPGVYTLAEAGTTYKGHGFILTGTANITIDTTAQTWQEFTGATDISVTSPIQKTGNTISLGTTPIANGGTGSGTAAGAKTNLGFMTRYAANIGNGSLTVLTVNHALNTLDVIVQIVRNSDGAVVEADVVIVDVNNVSVTFAAAPASNAYRAIVIG